MDTVTITIPPHYSVVAEECQRLNTRIQSFLTCRPQSRLPAWDYAELMAEFNKRVPPAFEKMVTALQMLGSEVLAPGMMPSEAEVDKALIELGQPIDTLLQFYDNLWQRHFPAHLNHGQHLLSAIIEKPLRDIQGLFVQVAAILSDPEASVKKYGGAVIPITLELRGEEECRAFTDWADGVVRTELVRRTASYLSALMNVAAGFFLGLLLLGLGRDD
ncbi:MAG: hypothetical protein A2511_05550 [Deltaproteobacteria bacterium RIFOXYD12_FULL_50_9]|nr:MAG: hypothetical protein A2511_05550 [Deltaproteobacteria bacterium RIFOXYD12_FULL_50_9]